LLYLFSDDFPPKRREVFIELNLMGDVYLSGKFLDIIHLKASQTKRNLQIDHLGSSRSRQTDQKLFQILNNLLHLAKKQGLLYTGNFGVIYYQLHHTKAIEQDDHTQLLSAEN